MFKWLSQIRTAWRQHVSTARRARALQQLDELAAHLRAETTSGRLVVLIGAAGSGKSLLASRTLPAAVPLGLETMSEAEIIIDEPNQQDVPLNDLIQMRNVALASGSKVIMTGQRWSDTAPFLKGLDRNRYLALDISGLWCPEWSLADCPSVDG